MTIEELRYKLVGSWVYVENEIEKKFKFDGDSMFSWTDNKWSETLDWSITPYNGNAKDLTLGFLKLNNVIPRFFDDTSINLLEQITRKEYYFTQIKKD